MEDQMLLSLAVATNGLNLSRFDMGAIGLNPPVRPYVGEQKQSDDFGVVTDPVPGASYWLRGCRVTRARFDSSLIYEARTSHALSWVWQGVLTHVEARKAHSSI